MLRTRWLAAALLPLAACDLDEVTVPVGEEILVVHGIMRPDVPPRFSGFQFIAVERAFSGARGRPGPLINPITRDTIHAARDTMAIPHGGELAIPVKGATVEVVNLDDAAGPCAGPVTFTDHGDDGVYWSPLGCPSMRPGDRLALRVETLEGELVTGQTRIPGMDSATIAISGVVGTIDPAQRFTINRDSDTLRVVAYARAGRLLQLEVRRQGDIRDFGTKLLADTTALTVPGDLINTFVLGDEDDVFRAGRDYVVTVAVTDTNYFDFVRSSNNEFTGRGFINRLTGGIGVFGSMVTATTQVRAIAEIDDPREGRYRVQGVLQDTISVDVEWELYLARPVGQTEYSAFVQGRWLYGDIATSADGSFDDDVFSMVVTDTLVVVRRDTLLGTWVGNQEWSVTVVAACTVAPEGLRPGQVDPCAPERRLLGTLRVTRQ